MIVAVREVRVSPDRKSVAIRSDNPAESWNAWGVMNAINGGHWSATSELEGWTTLDVPEGEPEPEPAPAPTVVPPPVLPPPPAPEDTSGETP